MSPYPNLRHLRLLDAAIRLGSLTRAAEVVHISQPAATQAMARLSDRYGTQLVERRGNGVAPTEAGGILHRRVQRTMALIGEAGRRDRVARQTTVAQLRAISAFAEAGSFTAAANLLGQTEPSVQRAARDLERLGGTQLFSGRQKSIVLTPEGRRTAERAGLALRELELAEDELREAAGRVDGRLIIGTLPLIRTAILPEAVIATAERFPEARIEVLDGSFADLIGRMRTGQCDMILGALRGPGHGLTEEALFTDNLRIIARTGHPLALDPDPRRIFDYPWVLSRAGTPNRAIFDRLARSLGHQPAHEGHIETGSLVAARGILLKSDRLALLSPRQVHYELATGLLAELRIPVPGSARPIGVMTLPDWQATRLQSGFLDLLRQASQKGASPA